jgi:hypothetical protein
MRVRARIATVVLPQSTLCARQISGKPRNGGEVVTFKGHTGAFGCRFDPEGENSMTKRFATMASAIALAVAASAPSFAQGTTGQQSGASGTMKMTQAECESMWNRADSARSGSLSQTQAQSHVTNFSAVDTDSDGNLSRAEFLAGCDKGLVQSSASTGGGTGTGSGSAGTGTGSGSSGAGTSQGTGTSGSDTTKK